MYYEYFICNVLVGTNNQKNSRLVDLRLTYAVVGIKVNIDKGMREGQKITFRGESNQVSMNACTCSQSRDGGLIHSIMDKLGPSILSIVERCPLIKFKGSP